jgi:hypothetical protein
MHRYKDLITDYQQLNEAQRKFLEEWRYAMIGIFTADDASELADFAWTAYRLPSTVCAVQPTTYEEWAGSDQAGEFLNCNDWLERIILENCTWHPAIAQADNLSFPAAALVEPKYAELPTTIIDNGVNFIQSALYALRNEPSPAVVAEEELRLIVESIYELDGNLHVVRG